MFTVYHSNQLDLLKTLIANIMKHQLLSDPFQQEVILVQSPGMAQWLQMQLAQEFGIAANIAFPLPATFIWDMFTHVLPDIPQESAFSKEAMTWKLMWLLPELLDQSFLTPLRHYLNDESDPRKIHQLAGRIADLFDQYLVYRPHWLEHWQQGILVDNLGDSQQWQAPLWAALVDYTHQQGQPEWHRANLYQRFIERLNQTNKTPSTLPPRIFICGISALPPVYLDALQALSKHCDIHLMFTNPCRYYWGDIQDYKFLARLQSRKRRHYHLQQENSLFRQPQQAAQLFDVQGEQQLSNPLIASWGKLGRDHLYLLVQQEDSREIDAFVDIPEDSLLHVIQHDMLELQDSAPVANSAEMLASSEQKRPLSPDDRSISFHACHSPQREVEVLHDQLLALFAADSTLTPRDVIVMVADIDSYTPYIQAVFGNASAERYLPFAISDRQARQAHPILQAFLTLLELPQSRFNAEQILLLLEIPALAQRFSIDEQGLRRLRQWVSESGIRWGLDDDNVRDLALPATGQHTWHFGLTRMLLGYAMESRIGDWQGVLPYDESSGLAAELAGKLAEFLAQLRSWRQQLSESRTLEQWLPLCRPLLTAFFVADSDNEAVVALIEQQWQQVMTHGIKAGYPQEVPILLIRDELTVRLEQERISQRFLAGPINFCTLMPMRSIPFTVVCLLGMNDGVYPRTLPPLGFDLMAQQVRRGDRSRRDDDRYLFLEALQSAQQRLYLSFIGCSIQDNSPRYPSVLVTELLEYIAQSHYLLPDDGQLDMDSSAQRVVERLIQWHTRMPFAAENFIPGNEQQSYAAEWLPAAEGRGEAHPDFAQPLPPLPLATLTLEELQRFYRHPLRAFFQLRLGVNFSLQESDVADEEPFVLDNLSRYQFNLQLLNSLINEQDTQQLFRQIQASGGLPFGAFGELYWQQQVKDLTQLATKIRSELHSHQSMELDLVVGDITLTGWLHQVQPDGLLRWRPAPLNAADGLLLWLEHLVYCLCGEQGESRMYGNKETVWRFAPLSSSLAQQHLQNLIDGYREGMTNPLILLNKSGWAWLTHCFQKESGNISWDQETQHTACNKLLQVWQGDLMHPGEGNDPYIQRVIREMNHDVIQQVTQIAERYLLPLARHHLVAKNE